MLQDLPPLADSAIDLSPQVMELKTKNAQLLASLRYADDSVRHLTNELRTAQENNEIKRQIIDRLDRRLGAARARIEGLEDQVEALRLALRQFTSGSDF